MDRRRFVAAAASLGAAAASPAALTATAQATLDVGSADRATWLGRADRVFLPVLRALAQGRLRATMPVETVPGAAQLAQPAGLADVAERRTDGAVVLWRRLGWRGHRAGRDGP